MGRYVGIFFVALIVGAYLGASFSDRIADGLQHLDIPLLQPHALS
jgi:hypothetical protein